MGGHRYDRLALDEFAQELARRLDGHLGRGDDGVDRALVQQLVHGAYQVGEIDAHIAHRLAHDTQQGRRVLRRHLIHVERLRQRLADRLADLLDLR